jgi:hypothetical protein
MSELAAAQLEADDLRAFLRALIAALGNPKIHRDELAGAISVVLDHEHGISIPVMTEALRRRDHSRGQTRPPAKAR